MNKFTKTLLAMSLVFATTSAFAADMNKANCNAQVSVNMLDSTAGAASVSGVKTTTKVRAVGVTR